MNNSEILSLINYLTNKEQNGNTLSIPEYNTIINTAQYKHFKKKTGIPEQYHIGQPYTQQQPNITEKVINDLRPFNVLMDGNETPILRINSSGIATLPNDYFYRTGLYYQYFIDNNPYTTKIKVVTDDVWNDLISSRLEQPTYKKPIANFKDNYIRFYPTNLQKAIFSYIRLPNKCYYDYYIKDGAYVYLNVNETKYIQQGEVGSEGQTGVTVKSKSIELEWDITNKIDIVYLALEMIGLNLKDRDVLQISNLQKTSGI